MINEGIAATVAQLSNGYVDRQKLRDLTRQVSNIYRSESRSELLREAIYDAVKCLPRISIERSATTYIPNSKKSLVVGMGDFHYGADIHVEGLHGETINDYNHEVFENRMQSLLNEIVYIVERESISDVHIFLVGDLIDGMLRQSQLMRLEYGIVESTMRLAEYLCWWLKTLAEYAHIYVDAAMGNHSEVRPLRSKNREFEEENLEKIIMWYLGARLADDYNITINANCNRYTMTNVQGFSFLLLHGDGEKNINDLAKEAINLYGTPIDYFVCGHLHKEQEYPIGQTSSGNSVVIRVPSICGVDTYAQSKGYGGKPGATAIVMEHGYGRRCVYPIQL